MSTRLCLLTQRKAKKESALCPRPAVLAAGLGLGLGGQVGLGLMIHHHKPECLVKKKGLLHLRSRSQLKVKMSLFVQISSKPPNILLPNLVL